jgi:hypothetical protein
MKRLAWFLAGLAVLAAVGGVVSLEESRADVPGEVGKWMLGLATAFAVAGAVSVLVRQFEDRRAERAAWEGVLQDLVAASHTLLVARLLLRANKTASTYRDQFAEIVRARAVLRGIMARRDVFDYPDLREQLRVMRSYLDNLGKEYEKNYLRVARQQLIDEERLKQLVKEAVTGQTAEEPFGEAHERLSAWRMLEDAEQFPLLTAFLGDKLFESQFRYNYNEAKRLLEDRAGIRRPRSTSEQHAADDID